MDIEEDEHIKEMQSARLAQEDRVRQFLSGIKPLDTLSRKISEEAKTEVGSPKKKKPLPKASWFNDFSFLAFSGNTLSWNEQVISGLVQEEIEGIFDLKWFISMSIALTVPFFIYSQGEIMKISFFLGITSIWDSLSFPNDWGFRNWMMLILSIFFFENIYWERIFPVQNISLEILIFYFPQISWLLAFFVFSGFFSLFLLLFCPS